LVPICRDCDWNLITCPRLRVTSMWAATVSVTRLRGPKRDCTTRVRWPCRRCCRRTFRTYSQLTPKRTANTRQLPSPRSCAYKILTRRSSEYARPIVSSQRQMPETSSVMRSTIKGYSYLDAALAHCTPNGEGSPIHVRCNTAERRTSTHRQASMLVSNRHSAETTDRKFPLKVATTSSEKQKENHD